MASQEEPSDPILQPQMDQTPKLRLDFSRLNKLNNFYVREHL